MDTSTARRSRIAAVQDQLRKHGLHAVVVIGSDPHVSEYLHEHWKAREWLTGFTGSLGTLVVDANNAWLFAEAFYLSQAERELDGTGIKTIIAPGGAATGWHAMMTEVVPRGGVLALDGRVLSLNGARALQGVLEPAGIALRDDLDLMEELWLDRPALPAQPLWAHPAHYATRSRTEKMEAVRAQMTESGATHHLVSAVEDVAWLTSLRSSDVPCNPMFLAHLLVARHRATLFVGPGRVPAELELLLAADGVDVAPYEAVGDAIALLPIGSTLLVDPRRVTRALAGRLDKGCALVDSINPSTLLKTRKNEAEADHIRETMAEDGAAMCEFYAWLERTLGRERVTELTIDERLTAARARRKSFVSLSFPTIAGFNGHGAMPHYVAKQGSEAEIKGDGLLLIDSGGQYLGGTTDITRVWQVGQVNAAMRRDFTLVLKAHIALTRIQYPRGTLSPMLDAIARVPLWAQGVDYPHGTGHGVGYFLSVHEGPHTFRQTIPEPQMAMEVGMVTSIEPALYRPGLWGVRIENLVINVPVETSQDDGFGQFLRFETLTLCPIDTRCIDRGLLRDDEVSWVNAYHATVRKRLESRVVGDARAWLCERTQPIPY